MTWGVNEIVAVVSALLAILSVALNWIVVRRQTAMQFASLKTQMDADVLNWAHDAIELVSYGVALARGRRDVYGQDFVRVRLETAQRLSASADRGRLFFPNEAPGAQGADKESAYQGFRPPILDAVVFACGQVERLDETASGPDEAAARFLIQCRRLLVSEVQNAIDPRRRSQMMRRLAVGRLDDKTSSFQTAADLGEALEERYPGYLIHRRDAAWVAAREKHAREGG